MTVVPAEAIKAPGERRWETIQIAREKVEKRDSLKWRDKDNKSMLDWMDSSLKFSIPISTYYFLMKPPLVYACIGHAIIGLIRPCDMSLVTNITLFWVILVILISSSCSGISSPLHALFFSRLIIFTGLSSLALAKLLLFYWLVV